MWRAIDKAVLLAALLAFLSPSLSVVLAQTSPAKELRVPGDHASVSEAVRAASAGDTVMVMQGEYSENVIVDKPLSIVGVAGSEATVITAADPEHSALLVIGTENVGVTGFTLKGSKDSGIRLVGTFRSRVYNNKVIENNNGIFLEHSSGNAIEDNTAESNEKGIYLFHSDDNAIHGNHANSNSFNGLLLHASNRNDIKGNETNLNLWNGITLSASNENVIDGNVSVNNAYAIVISDSTGNEVGNNRTMRRLRLILPIILIYVAIFVYLVERKAFIIYYRYKYGEQ